MIGGGHQQQPPPQAPPQVVYHIAGGGGGGMSQHQQAAAVAAAAAAAAQQQQQQHLLLHQGFLLTPQPYSIQLSHTSGGLVEELIKLSPPPPPGSPSSSGGGAPSSNSPSAQERFALLAMLEHKVEQLQSVVRCMSQGGQHSGGLVQPQSAMAAARLASSISQLALATLGAAAPPPPPQFFVPHEHHPQFGGFQPPPLQPQQAPPPQGMLSLFHQFSQPPLLAPIPIPAVPPAAPPEAPAPAPPPPPPPPAAAAAAAAQEDNNGAMEEGGGDSGGGDEEPEAEGDGEELTPGSYDLVEMNAVEILAEHTHFCDKCGKGFKRDANLRMHMRGHGEQYKSPAALARPSAAEGGNPSTTAGERPRRYSCPYVGCKRNKRHRKFQPLKTVLCVKNHYRRSHCPKSLTCGKCKSKKFSVVADLKTHEKHCGRDKWQCSCGTTFSRKDKLIGHIGLFQGHTPAIPLEEQHSSSSSKQAAAVAVAAAAAAAADGDATPTPPVAAAGSSNGTSF